MAQYVLIIQIIFIYRLVSSQSSYCFWGRKGYNAALNGHYSYEGTFGGKPYYKKTGCYSLYIYWNNDYNEWVINDESLDLNSCHASCNASSLIDCNSWFIYNGSSFNHDSSVSFSSGECPLWQCDKVQIPSLDNGCSVLFDVHIDHNVWTDSANTRYFYFNRWYFEWQCDETNPSTGSCSENWESFTDEGWHDVTSGENTSLYFIFPISGSYAVHCIMNSTTSLPTTKPTTKPTLSPSPQPTVNPTVHPVQYTSTVSQQRTSSNKETIELTQFTAITALSHSDATEDDHDTLSTSYTTYHFSDTDTEATKDTSFLSEMEPATQETVFDIGVDSDDDGKQSKKSDITLPIIVTLSSIALLATVGAVIWHWIKCRKKSEILQNMENKPIVYVIQKQNISGKLNDDQSPKMYKSPDVDIPGDMMGAAECVDDVEHVEGDGEQKEDGNNSDSDSDSYSDSESSLLYEAEIEGYVRHNVENVTTKGDRANMVVDTGLIQHETIGATHSTVK